MSLEMSSHRTAILRFVFHITSHFGSDDLLSDTTLVISLCDPIREVGCKGEVEAKFGRPPKLPNRQKV